MDPWGSLQPVVYLVGEAPGINEDHLGVPFVGKAGVVLRAALQKLGIPDHVLRINNTTRCAPFRPKTGKIGHPNKKEIAACLPSILADIEATRPKVVIALGDYAKRALLHTSVPITQIRGTVLQLTAGSYTVPCVPTLHPAFLNYKNRPQDLMSQWLADLIRARNIATGEEQEAPVHQKDFRVLGTLDEIRDYVQFLGNGVRAGSVPYIVTDIEGSALNPWDEGNELLLLGITYAPHQCAIVPVDHYESPLRGKRAEIAEVLRPLGRMPLANQNIKFDYQWYRRKLGIVMENMVFCTYLAHHSMFQSTRSNAIESMGAVYLNEPAWSYRLTQVVTTRRTQIKKMLSEAKKVYKKEYKKGNVSAETQAAVDWWTAWKDAGARGPGYAIAPIHDLSYYCSIDCDVTYRMVPVLQHMLQERNLTDTFQRMYMTPLVPWCDIQYNGIAVDHHAVERHCEEFPKKLTKIQVAFNGLKPVQKATVLLGKDELNINSPPQMSALLYDIMRSPPPRDKRKNKRCTDAEVLEELVGAAKRRKSKRGLAILESIQDFRTTSKNFSSYVKGIAKFAIDGRINPSWNIAGTDTGRASASEPPIHSQPKDLRDMVISRYADIGGCILFFDQSQVEVRIFGSLAHDPFLIQTYNTPGADVHRMLAAMLFSKEPEAVTDEERQIAKTCVFASLYGGGPGRIAGQTGMPMNEATLVHARFTKIIRIDEFKNEMWNQLQRYGHIYTVFGRIRVIPIPDEESKHYHAKNQCINTPIQSAASDVTEESITRLWWRMRQNGMRSKIILWHHDAIVWDVYPGELPVLLAMAQVAMVDEPMQLYKDWLRVPLRIEGGFGPSWRDSLDIVEQNGRIVAAEGKLSVYQSLSATPFAQANRSQVTKQWKGKDGKDMVQAVYELAA